MKQSETKQESDVQATAMAKVRMWESRAAKARQAGRKADADRCDDKVRDWASRARHAERIRS